MLQRIYGTAWETKAALDEHLHRLEEAEQARPPPARPSSWTCSPSRRSWAAAWPCGTRRAAIDPQADGGLQPGAARAGGYEFVVHARTWPRSTSSRRPATSIGTTTSMYPAMEMDNGSYYLKPMNCPMHCLIYRSRHAQLPRAAAALVRVRHRLPLRAGGRRCTACCASAASRRTTATSSARASRSQDEIRRRCLDFVDLGAATPSASRTSSPPLRCASPAKYVGSDDDWETRDEALARRRWRPTASSYRSSEGDAAFYGPKIDVDVRDAHRPRVAALDDPVRLQPAGAASSWSTSAPTTSGTGR